MSFMLLEGELSRGLRRPAATVAWAVARLVAGTVYLLVSSVQTAIAEEVLREAGDPEADQVSG